MDKIKAKFIKDFKGSLETLRQSVTIEDQDFQWTIKGFLDVYKNLYTISSDTKVVSKILELHLFPILNTLADKMGYKIEYPDCQNYYPDLTYTKKDDKSIKFAVDIKTTFRRTNKSKGKNASAAVGFTLGSHGGYFTDRSSTKNIQYPYKDYKGHFCLAVVYTQAKELDENMNDLDEMKTFKVKDLGSDDSSLNSDRTVIEKETLSEIGSVINNLKFYFVEKWKIASDSQGSGNTANIGSTKTEENLEKENGVFSNLGEAIFDDYWKNYGSIDYTDPLGESKKITNVWDYLDYRNKTSDFDKVGEGAKRKPKYFNKKKEIKINNYASNSTSYKITRYQNKTCSLD